MSRVNNKIEIFGAKIGFLNFRGRESEYNAKGDRNFSVFLEPEYARELEKAGWNIKWPKEKDGIDPENDDRLPHLPVTVAFGDYPPMVLLLTDDNITKLSEDTVGTLDTVIRKNVDVIIRPYNWSRQGRSGVKAYLERIAVTAETDAFMDKYPEAYGL